MVLEWVMQIDGSYSAYDETHIYIINNDGVCGWLVAAYPQWFGGIQQPIWRTAVHTTIDEAMNAAATYSLSAHGAITERKS